MADQQRNNQTQQQATPRGWVAIAAMSENRVIGASGGIPWHLPEDFRFFKATTTGHVLLMGRKTWDSIGKALPGRETVVISRTTRSLSGATVFGSLEEMLANFDPQGRTVYVAGGQTIYEQAMPYCSAVLLTHVKQTVEGDTFFPPFENDFPAQTLLMENDQFRIIRHSRSE